MMTRLLPHNLEAEQCVLGTILLREGTLVKVIELLSPDDFYRDAHQEIYAAMLALFEKNEPQDLITTTNLLRERNKLERAGGPAYLAGLTDIVPFTSRIIHYARIVQEKAILRRLIRTTTEITSRCYEGHEDIGKLVEDARRACDVVASPASLPEKVDLVAAFSGPPPELDWVWPGFLAGTVGVLVAAGGTGKSYWALQAAMAVANGGKESDLLGLAPSPAGRVIYLTAEDPEPVLVGRVQALAQFLPAQARDAIAEHLVLVPMAGHRLDVMADKGRLAALCAGARLVILDTISRFHTLAENDNGDMARLVAEMEHLATATGAAVLYLHHVDKSSSRNGMADQQQAARGASALVDNARWGGYLCRMSAAESARLADAGRPIGPERRGYYLRFGVSKQNYGILPLERWYERQEGGVLLPVVLTPLAAGRSASVVPLRNKTGGDDDW
ncbi:MAG: hypothetical protein C4575_11345 [Desulforudis sp.]|nr:MAG: hypothetical protein C4575_11345 [Desulforudis sp.]